MSNTEAKVTFKVLNKEFNAAMKEMKTQSSTLRQEFNLQQEQLKLTGSEADKFRANMDYLQKSYVVAAQKVDTTNQYFQRAKRLFGENSDEARKLYKELLAAQTAEQKLANEISRTNGQLIKQADVAGKTSRSISDIGNEMQSSGQEMLGSFGLVAAGITAGLGFAVKTSAEFEAQLSRVGAIAEATEEDLAALRSSALELGSSTSKSAVEVARGQEALAALGFTATEIIGSMPGVISAAEASGADMAQTAEVMASTLNIFAIEASNSSKVADILAQTANQSAADITDMQYALKYAGPPAAALGIELEELSAAIGIMTNSGMQGEQAGTTLRAALLGLLDPSEENSKLMSRMGIEITDAAGNFVGLSQLVRNLSDSMEGQTDTQKAATLASLVGTEAVSGMLSLMKAGPDTIDKMTTSLENSAGASERAAKKMKDNLKGVLEELSGAFETMQISIGTALTPAVKVLAKMLQGLINGFNNLSPNMQSIIAISIAIVGAITGLIAGFGLILTIIGGAITGFTALATSIATIAGGLGGIGAVIATVAGPVAIAIAAIVGLGAAFVALYRSNETFRANVQALWQQIQQVFTSALTSVLATVKMVLGVITSFFQEKLTQIKQFWTENGTQILQASKNVLTVLSALIKAAMVVIQAIMKVTWPIIKALIISTWDAIKGVISGAVTFILGIIKTFSALFTGDWKGVWDGIKMILKGAVEFIWNMVNLMFIGKLLGGIKILATSLIGLIRSMWGTIARNFQTSISVIQNVFSAGFNFMKTFVNNPISTIVNIVRNGFTTMKQNVSTLINQVKTTITTTWDNIIGYFKGIDLFTIGKNIIEGLLRGITNMIGSLQEKVLEVANMIPNGLKKALGIHSPSRRLAKEVGHWIPAGIAVGMEDNIGVVESASEKLAEATVPDFTGSIYISKTEMTKLANVLQSATKKSEQEMNKVKADGRTERSKITEDEMRRVNAVLVRAKESKRKLKESEELQINEIQRKATEAREKSLLQEKKKLSSIEAANQKERYSAVESYVSQRKQLEQLTTKQEVEIWQVAVKKFKEGTEERFKADLNLKKAREQLLQETFEKEKNYIEERKELNNLSLMEELQMWNNVAKRYAEGTQQKVEAEKNARNVRIQINNELIAANNDYLAKVKDINQRVIDEEKRLTEEYQNAVSQRANSIYSFASLFDEISISSERSGQDLLNNLNNQVVYMEEWTQNLQSLSSRGIDSGLIAELQQMGPKAGAELTALLQLSDEELSKYEQLWQQKNKIAKDQALVEMEELRINTDTKIKQLHHDANVELDSLKVDFINRIASLRIGAEGEFNVMTATLPGIGKNAIQGLIDGLKDMRGPLMTEARSIADAVSKTIKKALDIRSPSRVTKWMGQMVGEGMVNGLHSSIQNVSSMSQQLASAATPRVTSVMPNQANGATSGGNIQNITINSPKHLSPSDTAREYLYASRKLAMEMGG